MGGDARAEGRRARKSREDGRRDRDRDPRDVEDGGERGGESRRGRETQKVIVVSTRPASEELTPMALALRKAMDKAKLKKDAGRT